MKKKIITFAAVFLSLITLPPIFLGIKFGWIFVLKKTNLAVFYFIEACVLFLTVFAITKDIKAKLSKSWAKATVKRGEKSWGRLYTAYGFISVIILQVINTITVLDDYKTLISIANLLLLVYLFTCNSWFRNKTIGIAMRVTKIEE
mgnify:CR=1 FL=1